MRAAALAAALALPSSALATTITIVNMDAAGVGLQRPRGPDAGRRQHRHDARRAADERLQVRRRLLGPAHRFARRGEGPGEVRGPDVQLDERRPRLGRDPLHLLGLHRRAAGEDLVLERPREQARGRGPGARRKTTSSARFTTALDDGSCSFPRKWYYGLDAQPTGGTTDFATVVIHELGHGLGFQTFVSRTTGEKFAGDDGVGLDDAYMVHLYDATTGKTWPQMTDSERLTSTVEHVEPPLERARRSRPSPRASSPRVSGPAAGLRCTPRTRPSRARPSPTGTRRSPERDDGAVVHDGERTRSSSPTS